MTMGPDLCTAEHRAPEAASASQTPVGACGSTGPSTMAVIRELTRTPNGLVIDRADRHDAEQGYPWRWEVVYGDARRSGACQTRAQAEREGATVLVLLSGHRPRHERL